MLKRTFNLKMITVLIQMPKKAFSLNMIAVLILNASKC